MTYRPAEEFFGPPWIQRVPSIVHLAIAIGIVALVLSVEHGPTDTELYRYMFRQAHLIDAKFVAGAFVLSAISSILRAGMRGVRVRGDFIEYRDIVGSFFPKVRRIRWAQIDGILLEKSGSVRLELWDGSIDLLPRVADATGLGRVLERLGAARAIPVDGGAGLDDLDPALPEEDA